VCERKLHVIHNSHKLCSSDSKIYLEAPCQGALCGHIHVPLLQLITLLCFCKFPFSLWFSSLIHAQAFSLNYTLSQLQLKKTKILYCTIILRNEEETTLLSKIKNIIFFYKPSTILLIYYNWIINGYSKQLQGTVYHPLLQQHNLLHDQLPHPSKCWNCRTKICIY